MLNTETTTTHTLTGPLPEEVKALLREKVAAQVEDVVLPKIEVGYMADERLVVRCGAQPWRHASLVEVNELIDRRAELIVWRTLDPYHYGWEDESWDEIDWETCRLRVRRPGVHLECWIMGGQGSGKSNFCASRIMQAMVQEKGLFWCFALICFPFRKIPFSFSED